MENKFELRTEGGCIASSSSQELMLSLPKSTTTSSLSEHIYVNSIGDYYGVDKLVSLTNTKIKQLLQSGNEDESCVADLPIAIEAAAGLTGNRELMGVLASATAANISKLLCLDQFRGMSLTTDFSIKILESCANKMEVLAREQIELRGEINRQQEQIGHRDFEISLLRKSLATLKSTSRCRNVNCTAEFQCVISPDECILRCAKCRCKHYQE